MDRDTYQTILDNLVQIQFSGRISYDFYNEPLLHPKIAELVSLTKERLPKTKIHLYTNGTLLTEKKLYDLLVAGVDYFVVTRHEQDETSTSYKFDSVFKNLAENVRAKIRYQSYKDLVLVNRGGLLKNIAKEGLALSPCHIPSHMMTITVDGRVLSCFEDFQEKLIFGDLKKEKLIDIWKKDSYINFRRNLQKGLRHMHSPCDGCSRKQSLPPFDV